MNHSNYTDKTLDFYIVFRNKNDDFTAFLTVDVYDRNGLKTHKLKMRNAVFRNFATQSTITIFLAYCDNFWTLDIFLNALNNDSKMDIIFRHSSLLEDLLF